MDTARRWQVISVATAIAGLAGASLLLGRTASTESDPIDLDVTVPSTALIDDPVPDDPVPDEPVRDEPVPDEPVRDEPVPGSEIIPPIIREDQVEVPTRQDPAGEDRGADDDGDRGDRDGPDDDDDDDDDDDEEEEDDDDDDDDD